MNIASVKESLSVWLFGSRIHGVNACFVKKKVVFVHSFITLYC